MDSSQNDPIKDAHNTSIPGNVFDPMLEDPNLQMENKAAVSVVKKEDDEDHLFVSDHAGEPTEGDQAHTKSETDFGGRPEPRIKVEDLGGRCLTEASSGIHTADGTEGDPILLSDDEDMSTGSWKVQSRQGTRFKFQLKPNATISEAHKKGIDAQELPNEDFREHTMNKDKLQITPVKKSCEPTETARVGDMQDQANPGVGTQTKDSEKASSSDTASKGKAKPVPTPRRRKPKDSKDWHERNNKKQDRKRKILFEEPITATPKRRRTNGKPTKTEKIMRDLTHNQSSSSNDSTEASKDLQNMPRAKELPGDEEAVKADIKRLNDAAESFVGHCRPVDDSNLDTTRWQIDGVRSTLYGYQLIGCQWMLGQEFGKDRGGINADEMGLGKTIQALVCVACNKPPKGGPKTTLIVVPASSIRQWLREIPKHLDDDDDFNYTHLKNCKGEDKKKLGKFNIILASYQEVERSYLPKGVQQKTNSAKCTPEEKRRLLDENLGVLFQMRFWRVILDEAHYIKNAQSQTSIACRQLQATYRWALTGTPLHNTVEEIWPYLSFLQLEWAPSRKDIQKRVNNLTHSKNDRQLSAMFDIIMIRRGVNDIFAGRKIWDAKPKHVERVWIAHSEEERIIYRCVEDRFRELLTHYLQGIQQGDTPNNPEDRSLFLVLFLRLRQATAHPFLLERAYKETLCNEDIRSLQLKLGGLKQTPVYQQIKLFCEESGNIPFGASQFGSKLELGEVLKKVMATKEGSICVVCTEPLAEPQETSCGHIFCLCCIEFTVDEAKKAGKRKATCPTCRTVLQDWSPAQRARMSSDRANEQESPAQFSAEKQAAMATLGMSQEEFANFNTYQQKRQHLQHLQHCVKPGEDGKKLGNDYLNVQPRGNDSTATFLAALDRDYPEPMVPSAKTTKVKHTVLEWQKDAPDDKIIIFTQFMEMGQILGRMLQAEGIQFVYFFGEMSEKQKSVAIDTFEKKDEVKVFIASLKCGGVSLNLAWANRVIVVDPWWNASIENQAVSRVYRIGQEKETYIQHILVEDTIDERIFRKQQEKTEQIGQAMQRHDYLNMMGKTTEDEDGNPVVEADYKT